MKLTDSIRSIIVDAGGTTRARSLRGLLRELVTAYGGTPTSHKVTALVEQAIAASGGTATESKVRKLFGELLEARGGDFAGDETMREIGDELATAESVSLRLVPSTSNLFYVVAHNDRGTAFAHKFIRNSGAAADSANIGVAWQAWRYSGTVEMASWSGNPATAFAAADEKVYADDPGSFNYAFQISGKFMGGYHGGETITAESITMDGDAVDPTVAAIGGSFSLTYSSTITDGTNTVTVTDFNVTVNSDGSVTHSVPASGISSAATFTQAFVGMAIPKGTVWSEIGVKLAGGTEFMVPDKPSIAGLTYLSPTASLHATDVRFRNPTTGRSFRMTSSGVTAGNYRRTYTIQDPTNVRAKIYFQRLNTVALGTLTAMSWTYHFDVGTAGASSFTNLITNGTFDANITGWTTSQNAPVWNSASGGVMRSTANGTQEGRASWPITAVIGNVFLVGHEQNADAAATNWSTVSFTNSATSYASPTPALAPQLATETRTSRIASLAVATATSQYMMMVAGNNDNTEVTDLDNAVCYKVADAA